MAFKRPSSTTAVPTDPEQLYRQLALNSKGPEALWLHQGDVLRAWHRDHPDAADVAIELPTGAGKTLVGGLIGEYRRRAAHERVAYFCARRASWHGKPRTSSPSTASRTSFSSAR